MLILGRDYTCLGAGAIWEISVHSAQVFHEPKTILKIKSTKTKIIIIKKLTKKSKKLIARMGFEGEVECC